MTDNQKLKALAADHFRVRDQVDALKKENEALREALAKVSAEREEEPEPVPEGLMERSYGDLSPDEKVLYLGRKYGDTPTKPAA